MKTVVLFGLCLLLLAEAGKRCEYHYYESIDGWMKLHTTPKSWSEARKTCRFEGAELASPDSDNKRNAMLALGHGSDNIFILHTAKQASNQVVALRLDSSETLVNGNELYPFICYKGAGEKIPLDCGTLDNEYALDKRTGHCYKFHRTPSAWQEGRRVCDSEGGHLAIINSHTEAQVIRDVFRKNPPASIPIDPQFSGVAFIGVSKEGGVWKTLDGKPFKEAGYENWRAGEPNNAGGKEFCMSVDREGRQLDEPCGRRLAFICEIAPLTVATFSPRCDS